MTSARLCDISYKLRGVVEKRTYFLTVRCLFSVLDPHAIFDRSFPTWGGRYETRALTAFGVERKLLPGERKPVLPVGDRLGWPSILRPKTLVVPSHFPIEPSVINGRPSFYSSRPASDPGTVRAMFPERQELNRNSTCVEASGSGKDSSSH